MVLDPKNEEIKIRGKQARQNPCRTPNILLLFQHYVDTSYLDEDVGKLQKKKHKYNNIPEALRNNNREAKETHQSYTIIEKIFK